MNTRKQKKEKFCFIVGTRPEIIKMSPLIRYCIEKKENYFLIDTAQHYDYAMSKVFFQQLCIPCPKYALDVSTGTHAQQTAKMLVFIEKVLMDEQPDVVLVEGDTNTVLAGSLAARKLQIPIAHIEAGLRSFDARMPEEVNRVLTDHMSQFLFAPTMHAKQNLLKEGISADTIYVVGNTIVDTIHGYVKRKDYQKKSSFPKGICLQEKGYFLVTVHRQENVDVKETLCDICAALERMGSTYQLPLVYPVHPRTRKRLEEFRISIPERVIFINPVGYGELLYLLQHARLVLTDSGGIQEEACILHVPCVTLRISTERPETVEVGSNYIAGTKPAGILKGVKTMLGVKPTWKHPFGEGKSAQKIMDILKKIALQ